jgi:hypothetical protein
MITTKRFSMKKIYSLATLLLSVSAFQANAKTNGASISGVYPHFNSSGQTTVANMNNSRLIAKSHYVYNGSAFVPADSVNYSYTSNHGGSPSIMDDNDDNVFYDESYSYNFLGNSAYVTQKREQTYDANGMVKSLKPQPYNYTTHTWKDTVMYNYNYQDGLLQNMQMQVWLGQGVNQVVYTNSYIHINSVVLMQTLNSPLHSIQFSYDADNNLIVSEDLQNDINHTVISDIKDSFAYDASGRVIMKRSQMKDLNTGVYNFTANWTYNYGSGVDMESATKEIWVDGSWQTAELHTYSYDADHNMLEDVMQVPGSNGYVNASKIMWTYNSNDQPLKIVSNTWNANTSAWGIAANDYVRHFYYETYVPTGMKNLDKTAMHLNLYPNPATDNVNLSMYWDVPQPFNVLVYDIQGRIMQQWEEPATHDYQKQITLDNLASGSYIVKIVSAKGEQASMILPVHH